MKWQNLGIQQKRGSGKKKEAAPSKYDPKSADYNGDGIITEEELDMQRKMLEMEDADAQRDAIRKMAWFALFGLLLYPIGIMLTSWLGLDTAAQLIADIAPTYFASIAVLVSAFFGADALKGRGSSSE